MKFQPRKALTDIHTGPVFIQNNVSLSGKSKIEAYNIPFLRLQLQVSHSDGKPEMSRTKSRGYLTQRECNNALQ